MQEVESVFHIIKKASSYSWQGIFFYFLAVFSGNTGFLHAQEYISWSGAGEVTYKHIYPTILPSAVILKNPEMGIEQAGKIENQKLSPVPTRPGTVGPRNTSLDGVASLRYLRMVWWELEPADNVFHWATLDANINHCWEKGQQAAICVISYSPVLGGGDGYWQAIPDWYISDPRHVRCTDAESPAGCTYYKVYFSRCSAFPEGSLCNDLWAANQNDPEYIKQQLELIDSIRARYDNPKWAGKLAYIDMRNFGNWGEWHTSTSFIMGTTTNWPIPTYDNRKAIVDAFLKFEHIPVVANFQNEEMWIYASEQAVLQNKVVGWRTDGIDVTAYRIDPALNNNPVLMNGWKYGPLHGEPAGGSISAVIVAATNTRLYNWHFSGWSSKYDYSYATNTEYKAAVDDFRARSGYRLAIEEVTIPNSVSSEDAFTIQVKIKNWGITPIYRRYYSLAVKLLHTGSGSDTIIKLTGSLNGIMPGSVGVFNSESLKVNKSGTYNVYVGISGDPAYNPLPVTLANTGCVATGSIHWCPAGTIPVNITAVEKLSAWENPDNSGFSEIRLYSLTGSLIKIFSTGANIKEWLKTAVLSTGVYVMKWDKNAQLVYIGR